MTGGGSRTSQQLQHVVVEDNTVTGTRTGQSETMSLDGAITDFLVAGNIVGDADNIGIDTTGWETGGAQANHGLIYDNTVTTWTPFPTPATVIGPPAHDVVYPWQKGQQGFMTMGPRTYGSRAIRSGTATRA